MSKKVVRIKEWAIAKHCYYGDEVLVGRLDQNHYRVNLNTSNLIEGHRIVSSGIVFKNLDLGVVETQNTIYRLVGDERKETIDDLIKEKGMPIKAIY